MNIYPTHPQKNHRKCSQIKLQRFQFAPDSWKSWILHRKKCFVFEVFKSQKKSNKSPKLLIHLRIANLLFSAYSRPFCGQQVAGRMHVKHLILSSDKTLVRVRIVKYMPDFLQGPCRAAIPQRKHYMEQGFLSNSYIKCHSHTSSPIFLSGVEETVNNEWETFHSKQHPFPMISLAII